MNKLLLLFVLLALLPFVHADPTTFTGNITQCQVSDADYCIVNVNSTITGMDINITNRGFTLANNVLLTFVRSRLSINSTEFINISAPTGGIIAQGSTAAGTTAGAGGTGGSAVCTTSGDDGQNGATNGASGTESESGGCGVTLGLGSGFTPFDHTAGTAGTFDISGTTNNATGGGFYATGGVATSVTAQAVGGGSGQAIRLIAPRIFIFGGILVNGGSSTGLAPNVLGGDKYAAGGSGGGEIVFYGVIVNVSGTRLLTGSNGASDGLVGTTGANGGDGGRYKVCYVSQYNTSGTVSLAPGSGSGTGSSGTIGTSNLTNAETCFTDLIINMNTYNLTNKTNTTIDWNLGFYAPGSVGCYYTHAGVNYDLGTFFNNTAVQSLSFEDTHLLYNTPTLINVTCGNITAGIPNVTSDTINVTYLPTFPIVTAVQYYPLTNIAVPSVNFNWTCIGNNASYLSNLTIDGLLNESNIPINNAIPVNRSYMLMAGMHSWQVSCANVTNYNISQVLPFNLTNNISVTINNPTNLSTISDTELNYSYQVTGLYPVTCNTTIGGLLLDTRNVTSSDTQSNLTLVGPGSYNITVTCFDTASTGSSVHFFNSSAQPVSIISPGDGSVYFAPPLVPVNLFSEIGLFTACNLTLNNNFVTSWLDSYNSYFSIFSVNIGQNNVSVSCAYSNSYPHYTPFETVNTSFTYNRVSTNSPFIAAFDYNLSACPAATILALESCYEYYKIPSVFNFSAVVCQTLNMSANLSCVSQFTNVTKTGPFGINYTIYYTPSYWTYHGAIGVPNESLQLTGAEFIYNNDYVIHDAGMELIDNDSFFYVPAQIKPLDCGYYYTSIYGTQCSYGYGFVVNNRIIAIADNTNQWYTASGFGVSNNSLIPPEPVIYVNVIPLPPAQSSSFPEGIYTRYNCNVINDTYNIYLANTVQQTFTLFVTTNNSGIINQTSFSVNTTDLITTVDLANVVSLSLYDSNRLRCAYQNQSIVFLPFDFVSGLQLDDGFGNMFVKVLMLFSVVFTAIVPYAIIITFILNDIYHVLTIADLGVIVAIAVVAGVSNNIYSPARGVKNMFVVMIVAMAYLSLITPQVESYAPTEFASMNNLLNSLSAFTEATNLGEQLIGFTVFILNLFIFIITIPLVVFGLVGALLAIILPPAIWTPISGIITYLVYGATIWFYIKAYEVITNRFLPV